MAASTLPGDPVVLELLLRQATRLLEAVEPILAKFRAQDRMLTEMVNDPSGWFVQRYPFYRQLRDAIYTDIASLGPPFSALLPYLDIDSADGVLFREPLAKVAPEPGPSAGVAEMLRSVSAKHDAFYNAVKLVRQLQASIIAKLNDQPKLGGGDVPHKAGASEPEEDVRGPGAISPGRVKRPSRHFPKIDGLRWEEVIITFVSNDSVRIAARGQRQRMTFVEMGFADGRKGDRPDSRWSILHGMALHEGLINWKSGWVDPKLRNNLSAAISAINKRLRTVMQIDEKPFEPYKKLKMYKPKFKLRDESGEGSSRKKEDDDD
jgi:hypothetical protein